MQGPVSLPSFKPLDDDASFPPLHTTARTPSPPTPSPGSIIRSGREAPPPYSTSDSAGVPRRGSTRESVAAQEAEAAAARKVRVDAALERRGVVPSVFMARPYRKAIASTLDLYPSGIISPRWESRISELTQQFDARPQTSQQPPQPFLQPRGQHGGQQPASGGAASGPSAGASTFKAMSTSTRAFTAFATPRALPPLTPAISRPRALPPLLSGISEQGIGSSRSDVNHTDDDGGGGGGGGMSLLAQRRAELVRKRASEYERPRTVEVAEAHLSGLEHWPSDERLVTSWRSVMGCVKLSDGPAPWMKWPFGASSDGKDTGPLDGSKPSMLPPPTASDFAHDYAELQWTTAPPAEQASGYVLEVCDYNPVSGHGQWRKCYRGKHQPSRPARFGKTAAGFRARVKAYNGNGSGPWSEPSALYALPLAPPPPRREVMELPGAWLGIDLAGLQEFKSDVDPALIAQTKDELLTALHSHRSIIKLAFRYYAIAGVSTVEDDPSTMTMIQFSNFCRGCGIMDEKAPPGVGSQRGLSTSDLDRIFLRCIRMIPKEVDGPPLNAQAAPNLLSAAEKPAGAVVPVSKGWKKLAMAVGVSSLITKGVSLMNQQQYVGALVRIASVMYPDDSISLADKLATLCTKKLEPHVTTDLDLIDDDLGVRLRRGPAFAAVLHKYNAPLKATFRAYAAADKASSAQARRALATMNIRESHELCTDLKLYDREFGVRDLLGSFVRVNVEDEIYVQEESQDSASELVFDEFEELVGRIFHAAVWRRTEKLQQTANLLDQDGDGDFDKDDVEGLFEECDTDGSGTISLAEIGVALARRLNKGAAELVSRQLMAIADNDGNGTMSREELNRAIRIITQGRLRIAQAASKGGFSPDPAAMECSCDEWLRDVFVPAAKAAIKERKLG